MAHSLPLNNDVGRFRSIVERHLGLYFEEGKRDFLATVLRSLKDKHGGSLANYLQRLENGVPPAEWGALSQLLTVPGNLFFPPLRSASGVCRGRGAGPDARADGKPTSCHSLGGMRVRGGALFTCHDVA